MKRLYKIRLSLLKKICYAKNVLFKIVKMKRLYKIRLNLQKKICYAENVLFKIVSFTILTFING